MKKAIANPSFSCEYLRSALAPRRPVHWFGICALRFQMNGEMNDWFLYRMHGHSFDITEFAWSWFHRRNFFQVGTLYLVCVFLLARAANAIIPKYYTVLLGCDYGGQIVCWPRRMQAHLTTQITAFPHNLQMV